MDIQVELNALEDAVEDLIGAQNNYFNLRRQLEELERNIRKHAYPELIKQSNAQKMQLEFEHAVALDQGTWVQWTKLKDAVDLAEKDIQENKLRWEYQRENLDVLKAFRNEVE